MRSVHTFVTEDSANLVNSVETADDKALQVQFSLDTQVHFHIKGIVVSNERTSRRTYLQGMENRGINFDIAHIIQVISYLTGDLASLNEGVLNFGVNYKVNIALTVSCILILQTVPLFGQREERLGKELDLLRMNRDLALSCSENEALNTDDVTDVPLLLEFLEYISTNVIGADIYLDPVSIVTQVDEVSLTHITPAHDPAGDADDISVKCFKTGVFLLLVVAGISDNSGFLFLILSLESSSLAGNVELSCLEWVEASLTHSSQLIEPVLLEYIYVLLRLSLNGRICLIFAH